MSPEKEQNLLGRKSGESEFVPKLGSEALGRIESGHVNPIDLGIVDVIDAPVPTEAQNSKLVVSPGEQVDSRGAQERNSESQIVGFVIGNKGEPLGADAYREATNQFTDRKIA